MVYGYVVVRHFQLMIHVYATVYHPWDLLLCLMDCTTVPGEEAVESSVDIIVYPLITVSH